MTKHFAWVTVIYCVDRRPWHDLHLAPCLALLRLATKKKEERSCTWALSEWAHFLQRSCHMTAVNYAFGGAAGSMRRTPALSVNSIRYHRLSPRRACRVESNMATRSFSMRETWVWESGCDHPKPRRHVDEDQLGYQMLLYKRDSYVTDDSWGKGKSHPCTRLNVS